MSQGISSVSWLRCHSGNAADPRPRRRWSAGREHLNANWTAPPHGEIGSAHAGPLPCKCLLAYSSRMKACYGRRLPSVKPCGSALVEDGIPATLFVVPDVRAAYERLTFKSVRFTQPPVDHGTSVAAVFDNTCGNLIQIEKRNASHDHLRTSLCSHVAPGGVGLVRMQHHRYPDPTTRERNASGREGESHARSIP